MVKLCVFDMDGLLLDSERVLYLNSGLEISKSLNHPLEKDFLCSLMGGGWDEYQSKIVAHAGDGFPIKEYMEKLWFNINDIVNNGQIPLRPNAKKILDYCKDNNIKMALATSTPSEVAYRCLNNVGIADYFDYIVTGDKVTKSKPDPEIFINAISHFDVDINDVLIFEDGHNGSQAAIRSKARLVIVKDLAYISDEDIEKAYLCLTDLAEVIEYIEKENERTFSA